MSAFFIGVGSVCAEPARFALVIGNTDYPGTAVLDNPARDASRVAVALRQEKFQVTQIVNQTRPQLKDALAAYSAKLAAAGEAISVLYYSGHGLDVGGDNVLVMVDGDPGHPSEATTYPLGRFLFDATQATSVKTVAFIDACRSVGDMPASRASFSDRTDRDIPPNVVVLFATGPQQFAQDGRPGGSSPFAQAIEEQLGIPQRVELMFPAIVERVRKITGEAQQPFSYLGSWSGRVELSAAKPSRADTLWNQAREVMIGINQDPDWKRGFELARQAARQGQPTAMNFVAGYLYKSGDLADQKEGLRWFDKAARAGDIGSALYLASVAPTAARAKAVLPHIQDWSAESPWAAHTFASLLWFGNSSIPRDRPRAVPLYISAAERGFVPLMIQLSLMYGQGEVQPPDARDANYWIRKAVKTGETDAYRVEATLIETLGRTPRDPLRDATAFALWNQVLSVSIQRGASYPIAPYVERTLGWYHYFGIATSIDRNHALSLWQDAETSPFASTALKAEVRAIIDNVSKGVEYRECGNAIYGNFCPIVKP
jgi:TPR repeat protein